MSVVATKVFSLRALHKRLDEHCDSSRRTSTFVKASLLIHQGVFLFSLDVSRIRLKVVCFLLFLLRFEHTVAVVALGPYVNDWLSLEC